VAGLQNLAERLERHGRIYLGDDLHVGVEVVLIYTVLTTQTIPAILAGVVPLSAPAFLRGRSVRWPRSVSLKVTFGPILAVMCVYENNRFETNVQ
jgi:hypothetical protein